MAIKISKKGANTIKTLIILVVATMLTAQVLPQIILALVYPALLLGLIFLLPVFHQYRKTPDFSFFGNLCFAAILTIALILLKPFNEFAGLISISATAFVYIGIAMASERVMDSDIDATLMTVLAIVLISLTYSLSALAIPAFLAAAVLLDLTRTRFPMWVRGLFAAIVWVAILYGFANYEAIEMATAATFAAIGGLVVGSIFGLFHLDDEEHIEKMLKKI